MNKSQYSEEYRISQLLAKFLAKTITPEEEAELNGWRTRNENNHFLFEEICTAETKKERDQFIQQIDVTYAWEQTRKRLSVRTKKERNLFIYGSIAATIALLISFSILFQTPETKKEETSFSQIVPGSPKAILITSYGQKIALSSVDEKEQAILLKNGTKIINDGKKITYYQTTDSLAPIKIDTIRIPRGGEFTLILPDKTCVWLNSESEISFPSKFSQGERVVTLKGEAFFSVTKDTSAPFIVQTINNLTIKVLGTKFNIQAYSDENTIETTLSEGSVLVSDGKQSIQLKPDQQAIYHINDQTLNSRKVKAGHISAWREGKFIFENTSLESIMNKLSRWYDIHVFYANESVKNFHFTGDLERYDDFSETLRMLELSTNIHFNINGKNVIISETNK
ncbi:FecR family protein [Gabonibacter chumensis]|uniref:FecR family protein n=1 Tax=Gabonibacter chumensis TaxID=2972474 RepID=UPI002572D071|nr:FecR family protein [Gabonibacter chumensis]MCR9013149.1 FecR family protein [Gabonibacter chumensis]